MENRRRGAPGDGRGYACSGELARRPRQEVAVGCSTTLWAPVRNSGWAEDHAGVGTRWRSAVAAAGARAPANRRSVLDSKRPEGLQGIRVEVLG
jgi:hypothetical protein